MEQPEIKSPIAEETILFISILKWVVLASGIGVVCGTAVAGFLNALHAVDDFKFDWWIYLIILPAGLLLTRWIDKTFAPDADVHSTDKVIEAIHTHKPITIGSVIKSFFLPLITIGTGGSVGKEAPGADIAAGISSMVARFLHFDDVDQKKFVICGVSAGFASVFGVPISGAIFGVEVLFIGGILYEVLLPSFIAGIVAYQTCLAWGVEYFHSPIRFSPVFTELYLLKVIGAGIVFGVISAIFIEGIRSVRQLPKKSKWPFPVQVILVGLVLASFSVFVSDRYMGLGMDVMEGVLTGEPAHWYDPVMKLIFTGLTLTYGGIGGLISPILFIGTTAGSALAGLFGMDPMVLGAIGMVCLLAGTAGTPIAAGILSVEMFGPAIAPYATLAAVISFLMTGHRSVFPSQILNIRKSESIQVAVGEEIEAVKTTYKHRSGSMVTMILRSLKRIELLLRQLYSVIDRSEKH